MEGFAKGRKWGGWEDLCLRVLDFGVVDLGLVLRRAKVLVMANV